MHSHPSTCSNSALLIHWQYSPHLCLCLGSNSRARVMIILIDRLFRMTSWLTECWSGEHVQVCYGTEKYNMFVFGMHDDRDNDIIMISYCMECKRNKKERRWWHDGHWFSYADDDGSNVLYRVKAAAALLRGVRTAQVCALSGTPLAIPVAPAMLIFLVVRLFVAAWPHVCVDVCLHVCAHVWTHVACMYVRMYACYKQSGEIILVQNSDGQYRFARVCGEAVKAGRTWRLEVHVHVEIRWWYLLWVSYAYLFSRSSICTCKLA